ncbi:MAG TPA: hypothetical protein VFQ67_01560 [Allosphingosinicella sp.]|jgi:hypothetical protein|nr:hypothetical protein [Allosphingosinicella sp.]
MAVGHVVVFNCFSEPMTMFSVNGTNVGTIDAWNTESEGLLFAPAGLPVQRSLDRKGGLFFNGTNNLIVNWMGEYFHFDAKIESSRNPLIENLALIVLRSGFALLDSVGVTLVSGPLLEGPADAPAPIIPRSPPSPEKGGDQ